MLNLSLPEIIVLIAYLVSIPGCFFAIMISNRVGDDKKTGLFPGLLMSLLPIVNSLHCVVWIFVFVELCETGGVYEMRDGVFKIPGFSWISKANKKLGE